MKKNVDFSARMHPTISLYQEQLFEIHHPHPNIDIPLLIDIDFENISNVQKNAMNI